MIKELTDLIGSLNLRISLGNGYTVWAITSLKSALTQVHITSWTIIRGFHQA